MPEDDAGEPISEFECPACMTIADGTAAGWNGPLGDYIRCDLSRGHAGNHKFEVEWADEERSYGWDGGRP